MRSHRQPTAPAATRHVASVPPVLRRRLRTAVGLALSALLLSGCTAPGNTYSVLDQEAQPRDEVPADLPSYAWEDADPATARFVGENDGTSLWLARGLDDTATCLLAYVDEQAWVLACGGDGAPFRLGGVAGSFTVVPDGAPAPDGMTRISDNVYSPGAG